MLKTKIICTLGPSSETKEALTRLIRAGMNIARLNLSHGSYEEHKARVQALHKAADETHANIALLLDTKGPEIRLGNFAKGSVLLKKDREFILSTSPVEGDETKVFINYDKVTDILEPEDRILLDDGLIELEVKGVKRDKVICTVINGGEISNRKGVNIPNKSLPFPALIEKDVQDLIFGIQVGVDFVAASFVRRAADILAIRRVLEENGGRDINIIAKIENREGVENIDEIIRVADGIMIARGDLGVEIPVEEIPLVQKDIIKKCNNTGKPVITATQMLDSMIRNPIPTRAETTDVANAIFDGTDAIMLSGETAAGKFPSEAVSMMRSIAQKAEQALYTGAKGNFLAPIKTITDSISHATCTIAEDLGAKAIITSTKSGYTARAVAKFRPRVPIIAVTPREKITKTLQLVRGVVSLKVKDTSSTDEMFQEAIQGALKSGIVENGDLTVITAGLPVNVTGTTNLIRIQVIGDVIVEGCGIGDKSVSGKAFIAKTAKESQIMPEGSILVTRSTNKDFLPAMKRASAIIVEEGGLTSHAAIVGLELGIPVILGSSGATERLIYDEEITIDTQRGHVYRGKVDVK